MKRQLPYSRYTFSLSVVLLAFTAALTGCAGIRGDSSGNGGGGTTTGSINSVNHIVLMMQENRSFDHYFGQLNAYRTSQGLAANVNDLSKAGNVSLATWKNNPPGTVSPFKMTSACIGDLSSSWLEFHNSIDLENPNNPRDPAPMDGFAAMAGGFAENDPTHGGFDTAGVRAMGYYDASQLNFYYWAATKFATSDAWFAAAPTRTQPNRMYFLAATSNGYAFPGAGDGHPDLHMDNTKNIFQLLEENHITWKVYVTDGFVAGQSIGSTYMTYFTDFTNAHRDHFADAKDFAKDAAAGTLPQVALIESGYVESSQDEHPLNPVDKGATYVRSLVNSLMNSPSWKDSVMFVTFDEGGGLYDHVPPMKTVNPDGKKPIGLLPTDPPGDFTITGSRVPLIVISPFASPGFVSHTQADFTALLKFIEKRFSLGNLTLRDKAQPDMDEYFNWSAPNLGTTNPPEQVALPCYFDRLP